MRRRLTFRFLGLLSCLVPAAAAAQVRPETIRGRVTRDSDVVVAGAVVSATMAPDRVTLQTTTDVDGRYALRFEHGTGDYLMHVSAPDFRAQRKRIQRTASVTTIIFDVKLVPSIATLAAVNVKAVVARPVRGDREGNDAGAAEREKDGVYAAVAPDQDGQLSALAASIPGASVQNGGFSVLGLDASQSNVTLNGMAFSGSGLPRDVRTSTRVTTSAYDPSRGGFSAGQMAVELARGSRTSSRRAHVTMDAPPLQAPDHIASRLGQRFSALNASVGGSGEAVSEVWFYNAGAQMARRSASAASLLDAGAELLSGTGVSADSTARLVDVLQRAGIPLRGASAPGSVVSTTGSFATRLDYKPWIKATNEPSPTTVSLTAYTDLRDDRSLAAAPIATPSRTGSRTSYLGGVQAAVSHYAGNTLNDSRIALSASRDRGAPALRFPGGTVLVSSLLPDGSSGLTGLAFGGNSALDYQRSDWTLEAVNETQWFRRGTPHRIKLTADVRLDGFRHSSPADLLGTFNFPSISALTDNRASSFSRTLSAPDRAGGEMSGSVALGDYWRVSPTLLLLYGARVDASRFTSAPGSNPQVESLFGVSTSHAPSDIGVSPRLGFTWFYGGGQNGTAIRVGQTAFQPLPPRGVLRGGVGEFRNFLSPSLLSDAMANTGLAGGTSRLLCIGDAVPAPRFGEYATDPGLVPTSCASGASAAFSDAAPTVRLFDRSFQAPRSWRGNLSWAASVGPVGVAIEGVYSLNLNQPGNVDLNFAGTPRFALRAEGDRPVYVDPSSIVAGTGAVATLDARTSAAFGRVVSTRSDLRSRSRQLTTIITPSSFGRFFYSAAYTLGDMTADARGFDGAAFGSPLLRETAPGDLDVRHQIQLQLGTSLPFGMNLGLFGRFSSGLPYTPRVSEDVNGDGLANDRAFVFNPATVADPALAAGLRGLLATAPTGARACLERQLGTVAGRNSCRGPWTAALNARVGLVSRTGVTRRAFSASLTLSNPLAGVDQLFHGAGNLRGWGTPSAPDPTLLVVRGFNPDPATLGFRYEANPRFGTTAPSRISRAPFRITLDVAIDLGVPMQKQQAIRLLSPGRAGSAAARLPADSMAMRMRRQVPDLYAAILEEGDSLLINREQFDALTSARVGYRARIDSVWTVAGRTLAAMGDAYDADVAMHVLDDATERAWMAGRDELPVLRRILSPLQLQLAPWVPAIARTVGQPTVGIRIIGF